MFKGYTYKNLQDDIQKLKIIYPFLEIGNIGYTVLGRSIPYIRIGTGIKEIFYNASFHANEWITTPLLMKFIKEYCFQYLQNKNLMEFKARDLYENVSLYIVPMINPDGVDLVTGSLKNVDNSYKNAQEIAKKFPNIVFPSGWKANIEGVDLNLQFPAGWEQAKKIKYAQGFDKPAPRDYVGDKPLIAPESLAVYNFTLKHNFRLVIAYHTQGKEIYWNFQNYTHPKAEYIGKKFSEVSGYILADVPYNSSFAGYKDWFIQKYSKPGYTIEAGIGENPLPETQFDEIYENNFKILVLGMVL
nr:M14 family metallocarboxypeptidase [Clostridia bacterium]